MGSEPKRKREPTRQEQIADEREREYDAYTRRDIDAENWELECMAVEASGWWLELED